MNVNQKNQCDSCAFKMTEDQSTLASERYVDEKYKVLRNLIGAPKKPRKIFVGGHDNRTETCFINSPNWPMNKGTQTQCDDFEGNNVSLLAALYSREMKFPTKPLHEAKSKKNNARNSTKKWYEKPTGIIGIGLFVVFFLSWLFIL